MQEVHMQTASSGIRRRYTLSALVAAGILAFLFATFGRGLVAHGASISNGVLYIGNKDGNFYAYGT
jgi:hypothetical protein